MHPVWLDVDTVKELNQIALGSDRASALNQGSDLEGALNRPHGHYTYGEERSLYALAAHYAIAIAKAHAFEDGNKRTALLAVRAFLRLNRMDFDFGAYDEEAAAIMQNIATDSIEHEDVTKWIRKHSVGSTRDR